MLQRCFSADGEVGHGFRGLQIPTMRLARSCPKRSTWGLRSKNSAGVVSQSRSKSVKGNSATTGSPLPFPVPNELIEPTIAKWKAAHC